LEDCLQKYSYWLDRQVQVYGNSFLEPLKGKNLACWCPLRQPCHADILLKKIASSSLASTPAYPLATDKNELAAAGRGQDKE